MGHWPLSEGLGVTTSKYTVISNPVTVALTPPSGLHGQQTYVWYTHAGKTLIPLKNPKYLTKWWLPENSAHTHPLAFTYVFTRGMHTYTNTHASHLHVNKQKPRTQIRWMC